MAPRAAPSVRNHFAVQHTQTSRSTQWASTYSASSRQPRAPGDVVVLKWLTVERLSLLSRARQFPKWLVPLSANEEHSIGSARPRSFPLRGFFWGRAPPIECSSLSERTLVRSRCICQTRALVRDEDRQPRSPPQCSRLSTRRGSFNGRAGHHLRQNDLPAGRIGLPA